jgi:hypothetical protein
VAQERAARAAARLGRPAAVDFGLAGIPWSPFPEVTTVSGLIEARAERSVSTMNVTLTGPSVATAWSRASRPRGRPTAGDGPSSARRRDSGRTSA